MPRRAAHYVGWTARTVAAALATFRPAQADEAPSPAVAARDGRAEDGSSPGAALPGLELSVARAPAAADCPDENTLIRAAVALGSEPEPGSLAPSPLVVQVIFEKSPGAYTAEIRVSGRKQGVRKVEGAGRDCAALAETTSVVLAMALERLPGDDFAPPKEPQASSQTTALATPSREPVHREPGKAARWELAVSATGGVAYGMLGANGSGLLGVAVRAGGDSWEVGAGATWSPARTFPYAGEKFAVGSLSGRIDACAWFPPSGRRLRAAGCAGIWLTALHGRGHGYDEDLGTTQFWPAVAAGLAGRWRLSPHWALRLAGWGLLPARRVTFSVGGVGTAFETSAWAVATELGPELIFR